MKDNWEEKIDRSFEMTVEQIRSTNYLIRDMRDGTRPCQKKSKTNLWKKIVKKIRGR